MLKSVYRHGQVGIMRRHYFSTISKLCSHENPLGLPHSGTIPPFPRRQRGLPEKRKIRDVDKVVVVSSAKGGVGKSTIAGVVVPFVHKGALSGSTNQSSPANTAFNKVNLALAFARRGIRAGILDTDIFGPSIPTLLNLSGEPRLDDKNCLIPLTNYGLKSMSMGYLLPPPPGSENNGSTSPVMDKTPISWRGLMVTKAMHQLLHSVSWGPLDVLILDLPPGTGDVQLTINQEIVIDGAVIVSTPQDIALRDAVRGFGMFEKMNVPVLGMVRNMAFFSCPHCGEKTSIFSGGADKDGKSATHSHEYEGGVLGACNRLGINFLGDIPIDARVCEDADRGVPTVVAEEGDNQSLRRNAFLDIAEKVAHKIGLDWR